MVHRVVLFAQISFFFFWVGGGGGGGDHRIFPIGFVRLIFYVFPKDHDIEHMKRLIPKMTGLSGRFTSEVCDILLT